MSGTPPLKFTVMILTMLYEQKQRWEVTKYKHFVIVLKWILQSVLYLSIFFSDDFSLLHPKFVYKYLFFLLWKNKFVSFVLKRCKFCHN